MTQSQTEDLSSEKSADSFKKKLSPDYIKPHHVMPSLGSSDELLPLVHFVFPPQIPPMLGLVR